MSKEEKRTRLQNLKEAVLGTPEKPVELKKTAVAVLGAVEQNYGIYQIPSFREQVTTFWNDPLLKEGITMFAEQVIATGIFLTSNPKYTLELNGKKALDVIREWVDDNNIRVKLMEIAIELKAFGNSLWRITDLGFVKIPIEAVWHTVRVKPDVPLQEQYNLQLVPIYGGVVIPWGQFIHFRIGVTGYHAPFGQGVLYGLLAKPLDSSGNICPSVYDIRLTMRGSLMEGFKKFSFGNELWVFEGMSNEDFDSTKIGENIAKMSSTGNRIATNAKGDIKLAVPERTQSYDQFIKNMRDEFFMALADPTLKLGLEQGFTKATSITASELYKYKISTMRRTIKEHFEDLFRQILDQLGYDGREAAVEMNFGPEERAEYNIADIFSAVTLQVVDRNEARHLLSKYHKWDITGDIEQVKDITTEDKEKPEEEVPKEIASIPTAKESIPTVPQIIYGTDNMPKSLPEPIIEIRELSEALAGYNENGVVYIDPLALQRGYPRELLVGHEQFEYILVVKQGMEYKKAHEYAIKYEHSIADSKGMKWDEIQKLHESILEEIKTRKSQDPVDIVDKTLKESKPESIPVDVNVHVDIKQEPIPPIKIETIVKSEPVKSEVTINPVKVEVEAKSTIKTEPLKVEAIMKTEPLTVKSEPTIKTEPLIIKSEPTKVELEVELKKSEDDKRLEEERLRTLRRINKQLSDMES